MAIYFFMRDRRIEASNIRALSSKANLLKIVYTVQGHGDEADRCCV